MKFEIQNSKPIPFRNSWKWMKEIPLEKMQVGNFVLIEFVTVPRENKEELQNKLSTFLHKHQHVDRKFRTHRVSMGIEIWRVL